MQFWTTNFFNINIWILISNLDAHEDEVEDEEQQFSRDGDAVDADGHDIETNSKWFMK